MRTEAHAISGLGWVFTSLGIRSMVKAISKDLGITIQNHYHQGWDELLDGIIKRWKEHGPAKIILIGHSWGCWMIQKMCVELNKLGIPVAYIACLDATALPLGAYPMVIPGNVVRVREFWATSGVPAAARRRAPDGTRGGRYIVPVSVAYDLVVVSSGHVTLPRKKLVRDTIAADIKQVFA